MADDNNSVKTNQVKSGLRQARLILTRYELECARHYNFEVEKEIQTRLKYKSKVKNDYAAKIDVIKRIKRDLTDVIDGTNLDFMPDYYKT